MKVSQMSDLFSVTIKSIIKFLAKNLKYFYKLSYQKKNDIELKKKNFNY